MALLARRRMRMDAAASPAAASSAAVAVAVAASASASSAAGAAAGVAAGAAAAAVAAVGACMGTAGRCTGAVRMAASACADAVARGRLLPAVAHSISGAPLATAAPLRSCCSSSAAATATPVAGMELPAAACTSSASAPAAGRTLSSVSSLWGEGDGAGPAAGAREGAIFRAQEAHITSGVGGGGGAASPTAAGTGSWRATGTASAAVTGAQALLLGDLPPPPPSPQRRVVVTGIGLVTPLGTDVPSSWANVLAGRSGVAAVTAADIALPGMSSDAAEQVLQQLPSRVAAKVPVWPPPPLPAWPDSRASGEAAGAAACSDGRGDSSDAAAAPVADGREGNGGSGGSSGSSGRGLPRCIQFAVRAADEALADARWSPQATEDRQRTGVAIGGGIGSVNEIAAAGQLVLEQRVRRLTPHFVPRILINMAAGHVSIKYGLQGPNHSVSTACATGAHAVGDAFRMVRHGDADVMLAGGTEASIDALSVAGFCRLRALSTHFNDDPQAASRPFDTQRDGFVIGEGAGVLVLEELSHALRRGAPRIYAEVRGYGLSGDAFHITQPSPDGRGALLAMSRALKQAGLSPSDIGHVNAHATSTPLGDEVEARAILSLLGAEHAADEHRFALTSTKGATGHTLGAAGAIEAIFTVLSLHHGVVPPTLNLLNPDPVFSGGYRPVSLSTLAAAAPAASADGNSSSSSSAAHHMPGLRAALSNSFGFGGTNASLVFGRV